MLAGILWTGLYDIAKMTFENFEGVRVTAREDRFRRDGLGLVLKTLSVEEIFRHFPDFQETRD